MKDPEIIIHFCFVVYNMGEILKSLAQYAINLSSIYRNLRKTENKRVTPPKRSFKNCKMGNNICQGIKDYSSQFILSHMK